MGCLEIALNYSFNNQVDLPADLRLNIFARALSLVLKDWKATRKRPFGF